MDGNAADSSINSNHGTIVSLKSTTVRFSNAGKVFNYGGSGYITIPDHNTIDIGTTAPGVTISFWFIVTDPLSTRVIFGKADGNSCTSLDMNSIRVDTVPNISLTGFAATCAGSLDITLTGGHPTGGIIKGIGVNLGIFSPSVAGFGLHIITYIYSDLNNWTDSIDSLVKVYAQPLVQLPLLGGICKMDSAIQLTGGLPTGGYYSGKGVSMG